MIIRMKILYIEDDLAHVELTCRSLEIHEAEFDLQTAPTMQDAFLLLATTEYDVILCDYRLPDGTGLDMIKLTHERGITTAIVLITNLEDINTAVSALKAGAVDYLVKQSDYLLRLPIVLRNAYSQTQLEKQKIALRESESRYRKIFENAVEGIFQSSIEGRFQSVNPAMAYIMGYESPEEMMQQVIDIGLQIHTSLESRNKFVEDLVSKGAVEKFEAQNLRKDGSIIWTSTNARAVKDESGNIICFEGFLTDITERKQAELARQESESKYKTLVERSPGVVFLDDFHDDQISRYMSPRIKDLLGYTSEEWMEGEKMWEKGLHPEDRERILAEDERTNETREPFRIEYRLRRKDGRYIWIREDTYLISDQAGDPLYWQGILMDITAQKEAQEAIKASEGSYRGLFNSVTQAISIQDKEGRFLDVNDGAVALYGYPREFFIGRTSEILSAPKKNDLDDLAIKTERAFAGEPQEFEFWGFRSNGQVFPEIVSLNKGTYFGQDVVIVIAQDITERKQAEEKLERQVKELSILNAATIAGTQSNTEDEIIKQVVRTTARIYSEVCGVLLLNDKGDTLIPHKSNLGLDASRNWGEGIPITTGITGQAVRTGKTIRIGDSTKEQNYIESISGIKSEACVPFWVHDRIIGVFNVESRQADAYDEEDERFLNTLASGLGTAIEKLRLTKAEQAQRQREKAILDLISIAASSLDLNQVLQFILDQLVKVIPSDTGTVQFLEGDCLNISAAIGTDAISFSSKRGPLMLSEFPLNNYVVTEKQTVRLDNVLLDDRYRSFPETSNLRSFLGIPLIANDKTIGMITLASYQTAQYTEQDAELGLALASHASIAIENARLFREEGRRSQIIEALADIANEIATTQEEISVLDKIAERTLSLLNASSVAVYILQDDNKTIKIVSAQGAYQKELISHTIKIGEGITGNIIANGKPEIIDNIFNDPRRIRVPDTPEEDEELDTMMSTPLILHGNSIGAINAWRLKSKGLFDVSELNFLVSIAHQASILIESVRLFDEITRRAHEAAAIAEVGRNISATLELNIVLERIATYAKDLLRAETSAVYLTEPGMPLLQAISAIGIDANEIKNDPLQIGMGILGNIALQKHGEIVNDTFGDPRTITIKGTVNNPDEHIMGVPVLLKDQLTGLLVVWRTDRDKEFKATDLDFLSSLAQQAAVAIENARLFEEEQKRRQEAENLQVAATVVTSSLDPQEVLETILVALKQVVPYDSASIFLLEGEQARVTAAKGLPNMELAVNQTFPASNPLLVAIKETLQPLILEDAQEDERFENWADAEAVRGWMGIPLIARGKAIGYITLDNHAPGAFNMHSAFLAQTFAHQASAAIENARLYAETRRRLEEQEVISQISVSLRAAKNSSEMLYLILDQILKAMDTDTASIWLYDPGRNELVQSMAKGRLSQLSKQTFKPGEGMVGHVFLSGESHISREFINDPLVYPENANVFGKGWGGVTIPIRTTTDVIGALAVALPFTRPIEQHHTQLLSTIAEIAGNAIQRVSLFEQSEKQVERLTALREIDTAIASSFDLRVTLSILVNHTLKLLDVSAVDVLIYNPDQQVLDYFMGTGFRSGAIKQTSFRIGEGIAGKAMLERKDIFIEDLSVEKTFLRKSLLAQEGFISYCAMPLISKGIIQGILEVFFREVFKPNEDWLEFLRILAGQATIAIDNARLFENLQRSNQDLSLAYDTTLEGWGKALELRDKETHGHTRRVTDMTVMLARVMEIPEAKIVQIRRGVLLHDIGKMGISDNILRKKGPLTKKEWQEMWKHPQYAYDLLSSIPYLQPALDIPYSHHEWWDGSGYPRGLKGDEIPLSARIFAVVDVWDALLSERSYKKIWSKLKSIKYLKEQSGIHFDPDVVEVFLDMIKKETK